MNPALAYHEYLGPAIFRPCAALTLGLANIEPHEHVLDVACGTGIVTTQVRAARVVGLDLSPAMLEVAMRTPGIEWLAGSALALPLPDAAFDVVLCQQGMQFFKDREAAARELRRVCRGRAVVACWQGVEQQSFFAAVVRSQAKHLGATIEDAGKPFTFGDGAALGAVLRDAGFARVNVQALRIEARFPNPPQFIRMCVASALAVMPERFGSVDPEPFIAAVVADVQDEMKRFTVGDQLQFTMMTNTAVAFV